MPPLVIAAAIGAGGVVGGAAMAAHGQTSAAKTQAESADQALAVQKEMYEQQRQDFAPWRNLGAGAMGMLAHGMGIQTPPPAAAAAPMLPHPAGRTPSPEAVYTGTKAVPRAPMLDSPDARSMGGGIGVQPRAQSRSSYGGPSDDGMVTVLAPDGTRGSIPASELGRALQLGARRVD